MKETLDKGRMGHKIASYRKGEPRDIAVQFVEDHPDMSASLMPAKFAEQVEDAGDWKLAKFCIEWWMANEVARLLPKHRHTIERLRTKDRVEATRRAFAVRQEAKAEIETAKRSALSAIEATPEAKAHKELIAKVRILGMLMPNGLRLGDCTVADALRYCAQMGAQCAYITAFLQGRNDHDALVRDVLTPGQLATLEQ